MPHPISTSAPSTEQRRLLIGVDAGGTKTVAAAYQEDGTLLARYSGEPGNVTAQFASGCRAIIDTISALLADPACHAYPPSTVLLCVGAAGIEAGNKGGALQEQISSALSSRIGQIAVISDARLALYAAHGDRDGLLIISGTGSIGYRKAGHTLLRQGGWGHLLGDEGSGYDVVIKAARLLTMAVDTNSPLPHPLAEELFSQAGVSTFSAFIAFLYRAEKATVASLFPGIIRCAEAGDPISLALLEQAGEQLALLAAALIQKAPTPQAVPLACSGGVLCGCATVRAAFVKALQATALPISEIRDVCEPTRGVIAYDRSRHSLQDIAQG